MQRKIVSLILLLAFSGCAHKIKPDDPPHAVYDYSITFFVNARHLDYRSCSRFLKTMACYKDFGHAWIKLHGPDGDIEGGHSGELGVWQPKYLDGVFENVERGAENPISYLWCEQCDGFFQKGSGGHSYTFAVEIPLTKEQHEKIVAFIDSYPYSRYSIIGYQCSTFVQQIARLIDIELEVNVTIPIDQNLYFRGGCYRLYNDPKYSQLRFGSPDRLEQSLKELVN